jgi:NADH-quinone oxidoreductase subunit D
MTYNQFVPYTDRLDYLAPLANNVAYACAVEKLAGSKCPPAARPSASSSREMARISAHLLGLGAYGIDVGAWTVFLYTFTEREKLYKLFEELTGARFTTSYTRIGGVARDVPEGWLEKVDAFCDQFLPILDEMLKLLTRNRIFIDRTLRASASSPRGRHRLRPHRPQPPRLRRPARPPQGSPLHRLRAVRVRHPRRLQGRLLRPLPRPRRGDAPVHPHHQAGDQDLPQAGDWYAKDARRIFSPPKSKVLTSMEELINNFMIVTEGPQMPAGEVYFEAEVPKGALGFFIVSKGGGVPYRMKIRSPSASATSPSSPRSARATSSPTSSPSSAPSTSSWASATAKNVRIFFHETHEKARKPNPPKPPNPTLSCRFVCFVGPSPLPFSSP